MVEDIETGNEKLIPLDESFWEDLDKWSEEDE
jgi:hypothetical protein